MAWYYCRKKDVCAVIFYCTLGILYQKRYTFVRAEDGNAPELADEWDRVTQVLKGCGHDLGRIPIVVSRDKRKRR